ncbi:hypothetical protein ITJ86_09775 [Winogradskyella sp. F6397]|uniref:DUF4837 family protein n=1 Tax=Winogradskyella marina TaxID=2785530 RepID=A0ABS0EIA3_9FLAO|nr:hypothetical protein [Winogradskyella marina]MBF8150186.1 hypothetical protein [Winogradskyella marina]
MKNTSLLVLLFINVLVCFGQNERDIVIHDSIYPILYQADKYPQVKKMVLNLEKQYGFEPELKHTLVNQSYKNNDIEFFKNEIAILVKEYGFQLIYLDGNESYYDAIVSGELSEWFKDMFLTNHFIWLKNNFEKQIDLKKLNELKTKDQIVNRFAIKLRTEIALDSLQMVAHSKLINNFFFENISDLNQITVKYQNYPTGKTFALVQNSFGVTEFHNMQVKENLKRFWVLFYPYYKKAYLNNEISYIYFKNYDNWSFVNFKTQRFGLLAIESVPELFNKDGLTEAPIEDLDFYKRIKTEFNWD